MSQIIKPGTSGSLPPSVPLQFTTDSGVAVPALNNLNVFGGTGATTSGAGSTITIDVTGVGNFVSFTPITTTIDFTIGQNITMYTPASDFFVISVNFVIDTANPASNGFVFNLGINSPNFDNIINGDVVNTIGTGCFIENPNDAAILVPAGTPIILQIAAGTVAVSYTGRIFLTGVLL